MTDINWDELAGRLKGAIEDTTEMGQKVIEQVFNDRNLSAKDRVMLAVSIYGLTHIRTAREIRRVTDDVSEQMAQKKKAKAAMEETGPFKPELRSTNP